MDTVHQFHVFILCVCFGVVGGVFYELLSLFKILFFPWKKAKRFFGNLIDIVFWISLWIASVYLSFSFKFPSFRVYMGIGYLLGGILYLKILHKIVAFFKRICYNNIRKAIKKVTDKEETLKKEKGEQL